MSEEQGTPGILVSTGTFRLDRARAVDKLANFQLADPRQYVVELVASAVCAGASVVDIRNDADDFELEHDGAHPEIGDIERFFDFVFYRGDEPQARMVQHLAQAVFAAASLRPKWLRVHRPGVTLDFTDPRNPVSLPNDRTAGVRVEVRERFSLDVLWEWGRKPFSVPDEQKLVAQRAAYCPVPITVEGKPLGARPARSPDVPRVSVQSAALDVEGEVWLTRGPDVGDGGVDIVRDGVLVQHRPVVLAPGLRVGGWVRCNGLRLDASQSAVVDDERWNAAWAALVHGWRAALATLWSTQPDPDLRAAARSLVAGVDCPLAALPLFDDLRGQHWSLDALARCPTVLVCAEPRLADPSFDVPQVLGDSRTLADLLNWLGSAVQDGTPVLRDRAQSRARLAHLRATATPLPASGAFVWAADTANQRIRVGVRAGDFAANAIQVEVRVDGLTIETLQRPGPGGVLVKAEDDRLTVDARMERVEPTAVRNSVLQDVENAVQRALLAAAKEAAFHPAVRPVLQAWVRESLPRGRKKTRVEDLPREVRDAPLFAGPAGQPWSIHDLAQVAGQEGRGDAKGRPVVWYIPDTEPPPGEGTGVVQIDSADLVLLRRVFDGRVKDVGHHLQAAAEGARRRASGGATVMLDEPCAVTTTIAGVPGVSGVLGLTVGHRAKGATVRILREAVDLGVLSLAIPIPGFRACVSWDQATPTADWKALQDPDGAALWLSEVLEPLAWSLVRGAKTTAEALSTPPPWWVALANRGPSVEPQAGAWEVASTGRGGPLTLQDLVQRAPSPAAPIRWLPSVDDVPADVADGFVQLAPVWLPVVQTWVGPRNIVDGKPFLDDILVKRRRYRQTPRVVFSSPSDVVGARKVQRGGISLWVGLWSKPAAKIGLSIDILFAERKLQSIFRRDTLPWYVVAEGPRLSPDLAHQGLADPACILEIVELVAQHRWSVLQAALREAPTSEGARTLWLRVAAAASGGGLAWLSADERQTLLDGIAPFPLLVDIRGQALGLSAIRAAFAAGQLATVRSWPPTMRAPADRAWVIANPHTDEALRDLVGQRLPSADREAEQFLAGRKRYEALPVEPLRPNFPALEARSASFPDGGTVWVGLRPGMPGKRVFLVDQRPILTEPLPQMPGIEQRVAHPHLEANVSFDNVTPATLSDQLRERCNAVCGRLLTDVLAQKNKYVINIALRYQKATGAIDDTIPFLATSAGDALTFHALAAAFRAGPLRVVSVGATGRSLDAQRPFVVADAERRAALQVWGPIVDAEAELQDEEAAHQRIEAPRYSPPPLHQAVAAVSLTGPRRGHVGVVWSQDEGVVVCVDGRRLETRNSGGPVPLVGYVDDAALVPDRLFQRLEGGPARKALDAALADASWQILEQLLDTLGTPTTEALERAAAWLHRAVVRAFPNRARLKKATKGTEARLANCPVFVAGDGTHWSVAAVAALPTPPRWVDNGNEYQHVPPGTPFLKVDGASADGVRRLLGGVVDVALAEREHAAWHRLQQERRELALPPGDFLATASADTPEARFMVGLAEVTTEPARVEVWVDGRPADNSEAPALLAALPGLVATVDLVGEPARVIVGRLALSVPLQRAIVTKYAELVVQATPHLSQGVHRQQRLLQLVARLREDLGRSRRPAVFTWQRVWVDAPLLEGVPERVPLAELARWARQKQGVTWILPGREHADTSTPALHDTPFQRALVAATGLGTVLSANAHRIMAEAAKQRAAAEEKRLAAEKRDLREVQRRVTALSMRLLGGKSDAKAALKAETARLDIADWAALDGNGAELVLALRLADTIARKERGNDGAIDVVLRLAKVLNSSAASAE